MVGSICFALGYFQLNLVADHTFYCGNIFIVSRYIGAREMGDPSSRKSYLPPDKQFLITRNGMNTILMMHPYTSAYGT